MLGTITGDIIGSAYEKANYRGKDFAPLFRPRAHFTDDTVHSASCHATSMKLG